MQWKKKPVAILMCLLLIHVMAHIDRNMLLGFSPQIVRDLALSHAQYGFLVGSVWVLSFGAMAMFMGTLADRFSRPRVIAAGMLIWSACTFASGYAHSFEQMVIARFFVASGEAALVPAAAALLAEVFPERKRGLALGIFFMGIPIGVGCSFLLAGSFGSEHGWRTTFHVLGAIGVAMVLPLALLKDDRDPHPSQERDIAVPGQAFALLRVVVGNATMRYTIVGFLLVNLMYAGFSFTQLWLVDERGMDPGTIAARIGLLQLVFGVLGSVVGGALGDRGTGSLEGGRMNFMTLLVAVCVPMTLASLLVPASSPLLYIGLCAGFFLPLAVYGPAAATVTSVVPQQIRATAFGFVMLLINVFAFAIGTMAIGLATDHLDRTGAAAALTHVLIVVDVLALSSALFFRLAARASYRQHAPMVGNTRRVKS